MEPVPSYGVAAFRPGSNKEARSVPMQLLAAQAIFDGLDADDLDEIARMKGSP